MNLKPINQIQLHGFNSALKELINLYESKQFPSKILLSGQKGIGKCTLAYHLINYILSSGEDNPYNILKNQINEDNKSFILVRGETNPNLILIDVKQDKKSIEINQIRDLINLMSKSSFNNKPRFILIDNIEYLNLNSINALLKFLEEPNNNIHFILIHNNSKILETLKSRCLTFKLFLSHEEALEITKKLLGTDLKNKINPNLINYYFTPGNMLKLIDFFDKTDFQLKDLKLKNFLEIVINEKIYKKSTDIKSMICEFIELFLINNLLLDKNHYYTYFVNQLDNIKKFNLDEDSFFIEFKSKILNG